MEILSGKWQRNDPELGQKSNSEDQWSPHLILILIGLKNLTTIQYLLVCYL